MADHDITGHSRIIAGQIAEVMAIHRGFPDLNAIALASAAYGFAMCERRAMSPEVRSSVAGFLRDAADLLEEKAH